LSNSFHHLLRSKVISIWRFKKWYCAIDFIIFQKRIFKTSHYLRLKLFALLQHKWALKQTNILKVINIFSLFQL